MYNNVTDAFKATIRSPSRTFRGRLKINDKWIYANFKKLSYETSSSSEEYLQLGSAVAAKIELTIKRINELFENTEIPIEIGLKLPSGKYEYIPVGFFTAEHPTNDQATTTFTAYDRMMKTTGLYVSDLTYPASAVSVLNEISAGCGVPVDVSNIDSSIMISTKPAGYTYREMIGYIASMAGGFACVDRTGTIVIKWYLDVDYKLDVTRIMSFEKDESNYNLEKLSCNVDNSTTLTSGGGILGVTFDNPFMTQDRLDNIFKKLSGFSYRGASVKTLGDVRLDPWDMITVEDGEDAYKVPVMNIQQEYDGGLAMTITSYGKTQTEQEVDFKGPTTQQNERIYSDLILAKELIANKVDAEWVKTNTVQAETIVSINNELQNIYNNYLKSETADIKYANIDFSNIGKAAMEYFYAHSGLIKNVVVGDQQITGELIGVTIKGDLIEGNTIVAEKLVIKGDDGLYYKLNTDGMGVEAEQTEYNSLNGSIIRAKSITATKIAVDDLVAFDATIAGFNITDEAIYSGVKESALNTTRGIYLGKDGQLAFGDGNNYLRFYKDSSGRYKLEISAESMNFSSTGASVEDTINDINNKVDSVVSVEKSEVTYQVGTSGTVKPTGAWLKDMPSVKAGQFLWTRTLITYSDKSVTELFSVSSMGTKGEKGDQGIPGPRGETGATGIGVKSTAVTYQVSSSGTTAPTGTWSTSVPSVSAGQFLWTRTIITYSNNTTSTLYSVGRNGTNGVNGTNGTNGQNGKSIGQVVNYYLATNASSNVTASTSGWTTTVQSVSSSKKYLWNYEVVKYTDGTIASTTAPCIIGSYGDTGAKGDKGAKGDTGATGPTGVGIKSITEYYAVSTTNTTAPTLWVTSIPTLTASNKYLWNYETVTYTNNSAVSTSKRVIGVYGDKGLKGDTGAAGNGIASTAVAYQAGSSGTTAPTGTWSTSVPFTSAAAPYLWTRITIKYTNGTVTNSYSVGSTPEGISVGGRNLAESTNQGTTGWGWSMQAGGHTASEIVENNIRTCKLLRNSTAQSGWSVIEYSRIGRSKYEPNTVYTVSFDVKSNVGTVMNIGLQQGNGTDNLMGSSTAVNRQIKANQWNKLIWIIKTATTLPSSTGQLLYITGMNSGTGVWYQFKNLKIEKGNKATDWSPAPEDIDTKFNNYTTTEQMKHDFKNSSSELYSAINSSFATNGQVSAVDGKFSNYYTKTTIDSTIKQVKDSISLKVSQTDFDKQTKSTSASLELKLNKTDNNKVVAMLNASADTISLKSNRFTLDSTYTKIAADGTITCSNLNCTNAKITGGSVNITASSKEENKIILSYQDSSIKLAPYGINLITTKYAFNLTPMKLVMSFSGGGIKSSTTIDPNGVSTGSVKAETIVASSVLKIGPQSYGSNAATGARLEATNQDFRLYASPETTYYVRLGVDYNGSTVKHGWHFGPDGGGSIMLGTSSHAWSNGFFDGTVYIQHGDMHISTGSCYCYDYYYIWSGGGWVELSDWIATKL
ncbi:MAG: hypothetical protein KH120_01110 [Eubacterium sp.]|nr:hypothetical protein [Eubacterium sp.]